MKKIRPGSALGVALREPVAGNRFFVGLLTASDNVGLRITALDWITEMFIGDELWFPWAGVVGLVHVVLPGEPLSSDWFERVSAAQERHNDAVPAQGGTA